MSDEFIFKKIKEIEEQGKKIKALNRKEDEAKLWNLRYWYGFYKRQLEHRNLSIQQAIQM